jgi:recombination protein RecA
MTSAFNREKAVDLAISQIERQFGKGAIMRLGSSEPAADVPAIPTGSLSLDIALGVGGVPRGRLIEIFSPESAGRHPGPPHRAEAAEANGLAAIIDADTPGRTYPEERRNTEDLLISSPLG